MGGAPAREELALSPRRWRASNFLASLWRVSERFHALSVVVVNVETKLMADDKSKRGGPDRRQVAGEKIFLILRRFAEKHGISRDRAEMLIAKFGNDRAKLDAEAEKLKKQAG